MAIREPACQRTEQSGMGLPHSTTSRTEWHARISRQRRGVRQPYAALTSVHWQADRAGSRHSTPVTGRRARPLPWRLCGPFVAALLRV